GHLGIGLLGVGLLGVGLLGVGRLPGRLFTAVACGVREPETDEDDEVRRALHGVAFFRGAPSESGRYIHRVKPHPQDAWLTIGIEPDDDRKMCVERLTARVQWPVRPTAPAGPSCRPASGPRLVPA